jgi:hypothetical protein
MAVFSREKIVLKLISLRIALSVSAKRDMLRRKAVLLIAVEAYRVVRRRNSNIFHTVGSQMGMRLSVLLAGRLLAQEDSWYIAAGRIR